MISEIKITITITITIGDIRNQERKKVSYLDAIKEIAIVSEKISRLWTGFELVTLTLLM